MPDSIIPKRHWIRTTPIAHRGLHSDEVPENSIPAFRAAVAAGYAIELDIRLSSDLQLMVIHDANTKRMTGVDLAVSSTPLSRLRRLRLLGGRYGITTLPEVLDIVAGKVPLLIEIKYPTPARVVGPALLAALSAYQGQVAIEAFDPRVIGWFRRHASFLLRGQNASTIPEYPEYPRWFRRLLCTMPLNWWSRPNFIAYDLRDFPRPSFNFWQRVMPLPVIFWTVRTKADYDFARSVSGNVIFEKIKPSVPGAKGLPKRRASL